MVTKQDINPFTRRPVSVQGKVWFLFGTTGTGKTTFIQEQLKKIPLKKNIFDIDNEYTDFGTKAFDRKKPLLESSTEFKKQVCGLWENAIIFSEAGIFFTHMTGFDLEMREILKGARRRGNFVFFDFHSLSEIPIGMLKYCNYLVMKKTALETKQQLQKFSQYPEIMEKYKEVMRSKNNFETRIIEPRNLIVEF